MSLISAVGKEWLERHVDEALTEDLGEAGDITCKATIPESMRGHAELIAKQDGIIAGADWAIACGKRVNPPVEWIFRAVDGQEVSKGQVVADVNGSLRGILISERTALNGLGHLSGIATMTKKAATLIEGTKAVVLETRKTMPGWRLAEKYAVRMGGGQNHRMGLYDEILIKENHVDASGGASEAVEAAIKWRSSDSKRKDVPIEVEVRDLDELKNAIKHNPDRILLDNFSLEDLRSAVNLIEGQCPLEASGGITIENIKDVAETGVDRISLGALTHSVHPLDLSLLVRDIFQS